MSPNTPWASSTPSCGADSGNPDVPTEPQEHVPNNKSDQWAGLFGEGGYLWGDIDTAKAVWPLAMWCFLTGYMDIVAFSAIFVWCAFQTGNTAQLALALARLWEIPGDTVFRTADQQALCSLLSFLGGSFVGRLGDRMGSNTRMWLFTGTMIQAFFTMAAAVAISQSGQGSVAPNRSSPAWTNAITFVCLGFMSASMGLQGIMGKRINSQFATTVVLTSVWCELVADPKLLNLRKGIISRDYKILAIFALFLGAFLGRAILAEIGSAGALGVATGIRVLLAFGWLFVPSKNARVESRAGPV
ncbi:hypothetical protein BDM02DRAFT_3109291 [Thelephora ganbajun]|uniref:Uncharacterized protein n=1 Tax=Thelephora ganbajun TaxID=370292 RepID=A0ACB6ZS93_THEGA|nr:hypothetical protein BDM02DRAFT_3109291 [Thelephora ganbajun]